MAQQRLIELFNRYRAKTCTAAEKQELAILCLLPQNKEAVETLLADTWENINPSQLMPAEKGEHILQLILNDAAAKTETELAPVKRINWRKWAAAASLIGFIFLTYFLSTREKVVRGPSSVVAVTDVPAPDKNRAQIKLADGTIVYLDSASNGQLATQSNVVVTKTEDGKIIYAGTSPSPPGEGRGEVLNTLTNPRGSIVMNMTLSDGSKVWLNAGSSITYPVAFIGNERKITMTGEAYFEIAKHDLPVALAAGKKGVRMPFIVEANGTTTEVLGTHFNVNAYDDEQEIKVTLLEGSVKVTRERDSKLLKPGEQARLTINNKLQTINAVDLDEVMAWRSGVFNFNQQDISSIMREISRWYNVEIIYQSKPNDLFSGIINRNNNVSQVFKMLEQTNRVHFKIEGNKITVTK